MSDVKHLPGCDQANPKLWDAPCNCAEIRAEGIKYAYMEWQDKTEWVQKTAKPSELGKHRADVMRERIAKAEAERDQLRAEVERLTKLAEAISADCNTVACERNDLRAELEAIRGQRDVPLHAAVNHACGELPDGWSIEVGAERGGAWVTLYNAEMEAVEFPTDNERLDYTVNDAVEFALLSTKKAEEV